MSESIKFTHDGDTYYVAEDANAWDAAENGDVVWLFNFGVYNQPGVLVYGGGLEDALEIAAATDHAGGAAVDDDYMEEQYKEAAEAQGYTWDKGEIWDEEGEAGGNDALSRILEEAERDLTYTESGWLTSWEWGVQEIDPPGPLYAAGVVAYVKADDWLHEQGDAEEVWEVLTTVGATDAQADAAVKDFSGDQASWEEQLAALHK